MAKFDRAKQFNKKEFGKTTKFKERESDHESERPRKRDSGFNRRDSERSSSKDTGFQLYHAVCDKCGRDCDIPFKPTGNKPVYCRSCFKAGASESNNFDRRVESRERFEPRASTQNVTPEDIEKINRKLDKIMKALKI